MTSPARLCREIAKRLAHQGQRVVFAESCTAGLVSATLARVPGISNYLCGSAVTYRDETKAQWLNVPASMLTSSGAVSAAVAGRMAREVLRKTPEASLAVAITGHLGPQAPTALDGVVYLGVSRRRGRRITTGVQRHQLQSRSRTARQREAAQLALRRLHETLTDNF